MAETIRHDDGTRLGRRLFLGALTAGSLLGVTGTRAAASDGSDDDDTTGQKGAGSTPPVASVPSCRPRFEQLRKLLPAAVTTGAAVGRGVALDGETAMVSASYPGEPNRGSVYVYERVDGEWRRGQEIQPTGRPAESPRTFFGDEIALDGDTVFVSSFQTLIYVFERRDGDWVEVQRLTGTDVFSTLTLDGNVAAVGIERENFRGAVDIYTRRGGTWRRTQRLTPSRTSEFDVFGAGLALDRGTLLVGDRGDESGIVYVYEKRGREWVERHQLRGAGASADAFFGDTVAIRGRTAIVGAPLDDVAGTDAGAAYVFERTGRNPKAPWDQRQRLTASDATPGSVFGSAVDIHDTLAIVGAWGESENGPDAGAAYVYRRSGRTWIEQQKLTASDGAENDALGQNQSAVIDAGTALIGAQRDSNERGQFVGAAYLFGDPGRLSRSEIALAKYGRPFGALSTETSGDVQELFDRQPFAATLDVEAVRTRDELARDLYGRAFDELSRRTTIEIQARYDSQFAC